MNAPQHILDILDYAIWAPSGDNSQPWRFEVNDDEVFIYSLPNKDNPYLNFRQSGSLIALGGLIENILIASPHFGYKPSLSLFPASSKSDLVATVSFSKNAVAEPNPLFTSIKQRHTNRRVYDTTPLSAEQRQAILRTPEEIGSGLVKLIENQEEKKVLGRAGALAEIVILETKSLHGYLFHDVVWSEAEEKRKRHGLYINTMEFNPVQKFLFRMARNWPMMKFAIHVGFPKFIAQEDAKLYASGAAMGVVATHKNRGEDYVNAGRVMQRIWLKAASWGLALQPVTATLFFGERIRAGETGEALSQKHIKMMRTAYDEIQKTFGLANEHLAMMFRIGIAPSASARTSRIPIEEKVIRL